MEPKLRAKTHPRIGEIAVFALPYAVSGSTSSAGVQAQIYSLPRPAASRHRPPNHDAGNGTELGTAAHLAGIPASTLRYWETVGLLTAPHRVSGKRRYTPDDMRRIELVAMAKRAGFKLAEIRIILSGISSNAPPPEAWQHLAATKLPEIEQTLTEAQTMKKILEAGLRCECLTLEDCLTNAGRRISRQ